MTKEPLSQMLGLEWVRAFLKFAEFLRSKDDFIRVLGIVKEEFEIPVQNPCAKDSRLKPWHPAFKNVQVITQDVRVLQVGFDIREDFLFNLSAETLKQSLPDFDRDESRYNGGNHYVFRLKHPRCLTLHAEGPLGADDSKPLRSIIFLFVPAQDLP